MNPSDLDSRIEALVSARALLRPYVPEPVDSGIEGLVEQAGQRRGLGLESTVVALAGSTGSGKSSLFNAIAGLDLAQTGVRRPTTAQTLACVWGQSDTDLLLTWLGIPRRRRVSHTSPLDQGPEPLDGLVLLDLPDHDSMVLDHRAEVDRLVGQVDLFVWVTDPVKYADALLHEEYLSRLDRHGSVVLVAFNQVDRLGASDRDACLEDLQRLLIRDGLAQVDVLASSTASGEGVDDLTERLRAVVQARSAAIDRLAADVSVRARELATAVDAGETVDRPEPPDVDQLTGALVRTLGIEAVATKKGAQQRVAATEAMRWPLSPGAAAEREDAEAVPSGNPPDAPSGRSADAVVAEYVAASTAALPVAWREDLQARLDGDGADLVRQWELAVRSAEAGETAEPTWWAGHRRAQWASYAAGAVGFSALVTLAVVSASGTGVPAWSWLAGSVLLVLSLVAAATMTRRARGVPQVWSAQVVADTRDTLSLLVRDQAEATLVRPAGAARADFRAALRALEQAGG